MEITIEQIKTYTADLENTLNNLLMQEDPTVEKLTEDRIKEMIAAEANRLFAAKTSDGFIVGMITLIVYRIPAWKKAWIEDVVVDAKFRKMGIGTKLMQHAIGVARCEKVHSLNLTSRPQRELANKLYKSLGFEKRDTNVYRMEL